MQNILPEDGNDAFLIGRIATPAGPIPAAIVDGKVHDLSAIGLTVSEVLAATPPGSLPALGTELGAIDTLDSRPAWEREDRAGMLSPIDLQCIKASGVTFAVSALERVIEERARGDAAAAAQFRNMILDSIGSDLRSLQPGSPEAVRLKQVLIADGVWSQYLEVAIGPDAEIFTKSPVLSSVGNGADIGIRRDSDWNNPEPEIVVVVDAAGNARGATLGNDVNLRDIEGRSALLLGKAKDNNASCAIGPFIRLFDAGFTMDDVRSAEVELTIEGPDGYKLQGSSNMALISRDPEELIAQAGGRNHQYPDGFALFLGTMFAPVDDRDTPGRGFTHKVGDIVKVSSPRLGTLTNRVCYCDEAPPWTYGLAALIADLRRRDRS